MKVQSKIVIEEIPIEIVFRGYAKAPLRLFECLQRPKLNVGSRQEITEKLRESIM
jgi:hypothetical protein